MGRFENSNLLSHQAGGIYDHRETSALPGSDALIRVREKLLDWLTGSSPERVLNPGDNTQDAEYTGELTAELPRALKAILGEVAWDQGWRLDAAALGEAPSYHAYCLSCRPGLRTFRPERLTTPAERVAFWVNLYNALMLDAVITLDGKDGAHGGLIHWMAFYRRAGYLVGGHRVSLDDIEHGILRGNKGHPALPGPQFASNDPRLKWVVPPAESGVFDPRIHMAINCGGRSCPPVRVYRPEYIDVQLDVAARNFVDQTVRFNPVKGSIKLAPVFRWYQGDFGGPQGVLDFLMAYLPEDERWDWIETYGGELQLDYDRNDWSLRV